MKGLNAAYLPDDLARQKNYEDQPRSFSEKKEYLSRIGKAYRTFKWREERDGYYTRFQKERRKRDFLQNHAGVIRDFCRLLETLSPEEQKTALTLPEGREMKEDYTRYFSGSTGAAVFGEKKEKRDPEKEKAKDKELVREPEPGRYAASRKGESGKRYGSTSLLVHPENEAFRGEDEGLTREKEAAQADREEALQQGLSDLQLKGIRENCTWICRNAMHSFAGLRADRAAFLDTVLNKTPRELLLTFYCLEKGRYGLLNRKDIRRALRSYVPDPEVILSRMTKSRWISAASGMNGSYIYWNRLINAADSVRHVRMELLEMDPSAGPEDEEERLYGEELQEEGDGSGKGFIDDIRRWFRIADGEDTADGTDALPDDDLFGDSGNGAGDSEDNWIPLPLANLFKLF